MGNLATVSLLAALIFYPGLPDKIPVQWADGEISNEVNRIFIFAYPVFCVILRRWLRPYLAWKLQIPDSVNRNLIADYVTNFFCFVILSVEIFFYFISSPYGKSMSRYCSQWMQLYFWDFCLWGL